MAQSLLQSGAIHLTGTDLTVAQVSAFIESVEKKLCTHPRYGDHDRSRKLEDSEGTDPELPDAQEQLEVGLVQGVGRGHFHQGIEGTLPQQQDVPLPRRQHFWKQWIKDLKYDL